MDSQPVVVHNSLAGNDFLVRIGVPDGDGEVDPWSLAQWVGDACTKIRAAAGARTRWCITCSCADDGDTEQRFDVLVHQDVAPALPQSVDGFLILSSTPRMPEAIAAEELAAALAATPFAAEKHLTQPERVGVSAVSPAVMAKFWWSAIGGTGGLRTYRMLLVTTRVRCSSDTSGGFGWADYPPRCGEEVDVQFTW
jgi:hypothetical protein